MGLTSMQMMDCLHPARSRMHFARPVKRSRVRRDSERTQSSARTVFARTRRSDGCARMVEIVNKVERRFGSALMAYAWYRSEPLSGFSGQTAMQLVRDGRADEVLDYIDAVDAGVHA